MRSIKDVKDLAGKRVLVRSSLNVSMDDGLILDTTRLDQALATIQFLRSAGAKTILISHNSEGKEVSLRPVFDYLKQRIPLSFIDDILSKEASEAIEAMSDGDVLLAENLRHYDGEEKNDPKFAKDLASLADIYVNDDFTTSHREHASIVGVPKHLPSYTGLTFEREYAFLSQVLEAPKPSLAIIGGAKPETKIPLIVGLTKKMDEVFVGGVSANVIWQSEGYFIGTSATAKGVREIAKVKAAANVHLPSDVRVVSDSGALSVAMPENVPETSTIVDAGPATLQKLSELIANATFILWNGPLGEYEKGYMDATHELARILAQSGKRVIVGGGDTVAAVRKLGLFDAFTFVSTAGGAMIDFLADGKLPGIEALQ